MDLEQYNNIYNYLNSQQFSTTFTEQQKQQLQKQSKNFILRNNFIYKLDKRRERNLLRVIRKSEFEPVLYIFHNDHTSSHFATDAMFKKIRNR
jgi:nitrogen fixation protein FixH